MKHSFKQVLNSSILKKQMVGVTGLLLCGFLVTHLAGNFLIYVGPEAFNLYAHKLTSTPLIYVAEVILASIFLVHLGMAMKLTIENKIARGQNYYLKQKTGRGSTFASSTMPYTGIIILVFVIFHIQGLKFGSVYYETYNGVEMRDLYRTTIEYFANPIAVAGYIFAMIAIAIHTSHGFWSAFQSIGFDHPKYTPLLKTVSKLYALLMMVGFSALPIYCYMQGGN